MLYEKNVDSALPVIHLPQLALSLEPKNEVCFEHFCWGDNLYLREHLQTIGTSRQKEHFFYLWGEAGTGKSHLLQACCHHFPTLQSAVYLPLKIYHEFGPELLEGIEHQTLIAIDDIETISGHAAWEEALFHLINRIRLRPDITLLLASRQSPKASPLQLPDLKSRLHLGLTMQLLPLNDTQKMQTLQSFAARRGFELPDKVTTFLMNHYDRNMHNLVQLIKTLDGASLAAKRKITIPFIKSILSGY